MIALNIITENKIIADKIAEYLVENRLLSKPFIINNNPECLIIGRTKALLFTKISEEIKSLKLKNPPVVYSTPIVHMDWDETTTLQTKLEQV